MQEKPRRILCVEGSKDACDLVKVYLSLSNYDVATACTAAEGFELASKQSFDLILLSYHLPDAAGVDLCRRIHALNGDIPILLFSCMAQEDARLESIAAGASEYIIKPIDVEMLKLAVGRYLTRANHAAL